MATKDLYSKRNKKKADVYEYDTLPNGLKIQIVHIWSNYFKQVPDNYKNPCWERIHQILCEEHQEKSLFEIPFGGSVKNSYKVEKYFESNDDLEKCLDVIETVFSFVTAIPGILAKNYQRLNGNYSPDEAIKDLNKRFLENNVGYQYQSESIVRIDNNMLHAIIITEAFELLASETYKNANEEFLAAHKYYRKGEGKECIANCLKALESTVKIICEENKWPYDTNRDTASRLIDICFKNNLIPDYLQTHFAGLRNTLESGAPTLRNKLGGHGQGAKKIEVPDHYVNYMIHITGSSIVFLIACQNAWKVEKS